MDEKTQHDGEYSDALQEKVPLNKDTLEQIVGGNTPDPIKVEPYTIYEFIPTVGKDA